MVFLFLSFHVDDIKVNNDKANASAAKTIDITSVIFIINLSVIGANEA